MKLNEFPPLLEVKDMCRILRVSRWTLWRNRAMGVYRGIEWFREHSKSRKELAVRATVEEWLDRRVERNMKDLGIAE